MFESFKQPDAVRPDRQPTALAESGAHEVPAGQSVPISADERPIAHRRTNNDWMPNRFARMTGPRQTW